MSLRKKIFFKNANLKGYFFFLLFTTILAVIIKLAKVYTTSAIVSITIVEVPENLIFSNDGHAEMEVDYEASGFALMRNSFGTKSLEISFKELSVNKGVYEWSHDLDRGKVIDMLNATNDKVAVRPKRIAFIVDSLEERVVSVVTSHDFRFSSGYGSDGLLEITPPTVRLIGAADKILNIESVSTVEVVQDELHENINMRIALDASKLPEGVRLVPNNVLLEQKVTKYTEGTLEVPVEIENADVPVQLFPKKVKVFYQVPVKDFDRIRSSDFKIICDFSKKNATDQFMSLQLSQKPNVVSGVRLGTKQVQYVIVN